MQSRITSKKVFALERIRSMRFKLLGVSSCDGGDYWTSSEIRLMELVMEAAPAMSLHQDSCSITQLVLATAAPLKFVAHGDWPIGILECQSSNCQINLPQDFLSIQHLAREISSLFGACSWQRPIRLKSSSYVSF